MERLTITSFGTRPTSIAEIQAIERDGAIGAPPCDKWAVLRDLNVAREAFGVSDRDLVVLNALLSFHPDVELDCAEPLIVFPSNRSLAERAHGMAESTLRRHIGALVASGLLQRHDSPNGKRYVRRGQHGEIALAFGFDLAPLAARAEEIATAAQDARAASMRRQLARERASLRLRDASKLFELLLEDGGADLADADALAAARRTLRRKSSEEELAEIEAQLMTMVDRFMTSIGDNETGIMDGNDLQNECRHHNSNPEITDIEPSLEKAEGERPSPPIPLALVRKACPEISLYVSDEVRSWRDLHRAAAFVRGMLGISEDAWRTACEEMGESVAAIVVACILQRYEAIRSPGGYLRALTEKASQGAFSPGPMVMALLSTTPSPEKKLTAVNFSEDDRT